MSNPPISGPLSVELEGHIRYFVTQRWGTHYVEAGFESLRQVLLAALSDIAACRFLGNGQPAGWRDAKVKQMLGLGQVRPGKGVTTPYLARWEGLVSYFAEDAVSDSMEMLRERPFAQDLTAPQFRALEPQVAAWVEDFFKTLVVNTFFDFELRHLLEVRAPHGFFDHTVRLQDWPLSKQAIRDCHWTKPRLSHEVVPLSSGLTASTRAYRDDCFEDEDCVDCLCFDSMARDPQGVSQGFAQASMYSLRSSEDMLVAADERNQSDADAVAELSERSAEARHFVNVRGGAVLIVDKWEMHEAYRGRGLGAQLLQALIRRARRLARCPVFVVMNLHPLQFPRLNYHSVEGSVQAQYLGAMESLSAYLPKALGGELFPAIEEDSTWMARHGTLEREEDEGLMLLGQTLLKGRLGAAK
jgi:GNAT superfamily N-acetyltransferase